MRYKLLLPVMALMLSCNFITGLGSGSSEGSVDYDAPADPLNVTIVLNEADSVSGMISPEGGELTFSSADGNIYTLEVPAGALDVETEIVMTSVESIEGTATGDGLFAVQLEPSGLRFNELVTLSIMPAMDVSGEDLMFIKYEGNGEDVHLALVDPFTEEIDVLLLDFSGIGYGFQSILGTIVCIDGSCSILPPSPQQRLEHALGETAQRLSKDKTKAGQAKAKRDMQKLLDEYKKKIVDEKIKEAKYDCSKVKDAETALRTLEAYRAKLDPGSVAADKKARTQLNAIKKGCPKIFNVTKSVGPINYTGAVICDINERFTLHGSFSSRVGSCEGTIVFSGGYSGTVKETLTCDLGLTAVLIGTYEVWTSPDGATGTISSPSPLGSSGDMELPDLATLFFKDYPLDMELRRSDVECAK